MLFLSNYKPNMIIGTLFYVKNNWDVVMLFTLPSLNVMASGAFLPMAFGVRVHF